jgi:hypothetical protein
VNTRVSTPKKYWQRNYPRILGLSHNPVGKTYNKGLLALVKTAIQVKDFTEWFLICGATSFLLFLPQEFSKMCTHAFNKVIS